MKIYLPARMLNGQCTRLRRVQLFGTSPSFSLLSTVKLAGIFILLVIAQTSLIAQVRVEYAPDVTGIQLTAVERAKFSETIGKSLATYQQLGRLDKVGNQESIQKFIDLFQKKSATELFPDYVDGATSLVNITGYIESIQRYFYRNGLRFRLDEPGLITSVQPYDGDAAYEVRLKVGKSMIDYLAKDKKTVEGDFFRELEFVYILKKATPEVALINVIRLPVGPVRLIAESSQIVMLGLQGGFGLASSSESASFASIAETGMIENNGGPKLGLEVSWMHNGPLPGENLFLAFGLGGFSQRVDTDLNNYSTSASMPLLGQRRDNSAGLQTISETATRRASNVNLTEEVSAMGLSIPVGLALRVMNSSSGSAFIGFRYVPTFLLSASGSLSGEGDYSFSVTDDDISFSTNDAGFYNPADAAFEAAYGLGAERSIESAPEPETKLYHGIRLSGVYLKDISSSSSTLGVGIGLHYYLPLTSPFTESTQEGQPFLAPADGTVGNSITSSFLENVKFGELGISLNIYLKK